MSVHTPPWKICWLTYQFARGYWLATGCMTATAIYLYWLRGPATLQSLIYFKLITSTIVMIANYRRKFPDDVFYLNFGVSLSLLVTLACAADLLIWSVGTILIR